MKTVPSKLPIIYQVLQKLAMLRGRKDRDDVNVHIMQNLSPYSVNTSAAAEPPLL